MQFDPNLSRDFYPLWKKYKPAIIHTMKEAMGKGEPQQYGFSKHEFDDINPKNTAAYSFAFTVTSGMRMETAKKSHIADDLLLLLKGSEKALELVDQASFRFELDKSFKLNITATMNEAAAPSEEEEASTEE